VRVRQATPGDTERIWALNHIPNIGATADPDAPLPLPAVDRPPANFPDLADVEATFIAAGGEFLVVELNGHLVAMGGIRGNGPRRAEVRHVRVHPARRRLGIGRLLMTALESRAAQLGYNQMLLDTAGNQPEAIAFYTALGYEESGRQTRPEWSWTLVYFTKSLCLPPEREERTAEGA
jgi:ribosomal protein S18 acetylase RimI-like enzyme